MTHDPAASDATAAPPVICELQPVPPVLAAVRALRDWPGLVLFDSAVSGEPLGRYSFLTADPAQAVTHSAAVYGADPFRELRAAQQSYATLPQPDLPPFQGGVAGFLAYELGGCWERVPPARCDDFGLPVLSAGVYDWVLSWDHVQQRAWIVSQGYPEREPVRRRERAAERAAAVRRQLEQPPAQVFTAAAPPRAREHLAPQWAADDRRDLWSNFSREGYLRAVQRVIEYIRAGDIFQANLSQRLLTPARTDAVSLYERLRTVNAAPFAGLLLRDDWAILSASPERFLQVTGDYVTTRPIKGTRRRAATPEADLFTKDELRESAKDQAENVMIVDLLRNDLSRVCRPGTVRVPQLCGVETYATVQHLVSEVCGRLEPGRSAWDLLQAALPGGSITGAPKVRAMEIIAELEPTVRGPYTGSLFYVGFDGRSDSNLLIRTFVMRSGWLQCGVGGGVVAQSDPLAEYAETWHKAAGMLRALDSGSRT